MFRSIKSLLSIFSLSLIPITPAVSKSSILGALPDYASLLGLVTQLQQNGSNVGLPTNFQIVNSASAATYNAATVPGGIWGCVLQRKGGAGLTDVLDTANNIVAGIGPNAFVGMTGLFLLANTNSGTIVLSAGTNVTLAGTTTCITVAARFYQLLVTNLAQPGANNDGQPFGASTTNTTTTTAAVAAPVAGAAGVVIPVTANTGIIVGSALSWTDTLGIKQNGIVSAVNSNNITVNNPATNGIANGAAIGVWNNLVTVTGMFQIGANIAA